MLQPMTLARWRPLAQAGAVDVSCARVDGGAEAGIEDFQPRERGAAAAAEPQHVAGRGKPDDVVIRPFGEQPPADAAMRRDRPDQDRPTTSWRALVFAVEINPAPVVVPAVACTMR